MNMLIDFTISNHLSIKNEMIFSAETGERLTRLKKTNTTVENGIKLLKSLVVVGPNGSGKSNLIDGLNLMKNMVLQNSATVGDVLPYHPFAMDNLKPHPVNMAIRFNYDNQTYRYQFSFMSDHIVSEELGIIKNGKEKIYFSRNNQEYNVLPLALKPVSKATRPNALFLFSAQQANDEVAANVFKWFLNDLVLVGNRGIPNSLLKLLERPEIKVEFLRFLRMADFNIEDVNVREVKIPVPDGLKRVFAALNQTPPAVPETALQLFTVHNKYNPSGESDGMTELPLEMESRGTQKIFLIALTIINAQVNGNRKTIVIDEFDDSLHFELSSALMQVFNSLPNLNQFILTTHELQLLDNYLRTDQIYLMEKNFKGESELKSIFDFKDSKHAGRSDVSYMRRYIEGRFGAIPVIRVDQMLEVLSMVNPMHKE